jgi:hypothetical protein
MLEMHLHKGQRVTLLMPNHSEINHLASLRGLEETEVDIQRQFTHPKGQTQVRRARSMSASVREVEVIGPAMQ